jgi:hypothetical protein
VVSFVSEMLPPPEERLAAVRSLPDAFRMMSPDVFAHKVPPVTAADCVSCPDPTEIETGARPLGNTPEAMPAIPSTVPMFRSVPPALLKLKPEPAEARALPLKVWTLFASVSVTLPAPALSDGTVIVAPDICVMVPVLAWIRLSPGALVMPSDD